MNSYDRGYEQGKIQGQVDKRVEICRKLRFWAEATRRTNPNIAIGYDNSIYLIERDFNFDMSLIDWGEIEKCCDSCIHKKTHDELTENGNVPMCCIHCKYADDLYDKWEKKNS